MSTSVAPRSLLGSWTDTALFFARPVALHRDTDSSAVLAEVADVVNELQAGVDGTVVGVGVGVAGGVDQSRSLVYFAPNFGMDPRSGTHSSRSRDGAWPAWWRTTVRRRRGRETRFGAGVGLEHVVTVTVGTGIGGGIVVDGRVLRGAHGVAAEIGHLNAVPNGRLCGCGRTVVLGAVRERQRPRARGAGIGGRTATGSDGCFLNSETEQPEGRSGRSPSTDAARRGDPICYRGVRQRRRLARQGAREPHGHRGSGRLRDRWGSLRCRRSDPGERAANAQPIDFPAERTGHIRRSCWPSSVMMPASWGLPTLRAYPGNRNLGNRNPLRDRTRPKRRPRRRGPRPVGCVGPGGRSR